MLVSALRYIHYTISALRYTKPIGRSALRFTMVARQRLALYTTLHDSALLYTTITGRSALRYTRGRHALYKQARDTAPCAIQRLALYSGYS